MVNKTDVVDSPSEKETDETDEDQMYLVRIKNLGAIVGSMCHTIERTDRQGYPNC
jgi:hypothetical protein